MGLKFGTSGLRGLVTDLTDTVVARYAAAFVDCLDDVDTVLIGCDLRASSPRIAHAVAAGVRAAGVHPVDCGAVPTPALALAAQSRRAAAIMVTGSHIPADRNGLKFYTSTGEITKAHEAQIAAGFAQGNTAWQAGPVPRDDTVLSSFRNRYGRAFGGQPLSGWRVGVYQHSSVARDVLVDILSDLGATVTPFGRSADFVPVDTEAVDPDMVRDLADGLDGSGFDAIASTDGDADRPMLADHTGQIIPGDRLGVLTAREIGARVVVTPVSSNSMVGLIPAFDQVIRTKIGSPFVIEGMARHRTSSVVGYEANGGFLLGFDIEGGPSALWTRDCVLPIIMPLIAAARRGQSLHHLNADLPDRHTHAVRLQQVAPQKAQKLLAKLIPGDAAYSNIFAGQGAEHWRDTIDGLRLGFAGDEIIHLRASGNAPELRCYAEAASPDRAQHLARRTLDRVAAMLT